MGPQTPPDPDPAGPDHSARRLHVYNAGFLTQARLRRMLALAGWQVTLGWPRRNAPDKWVGVWGRSPYAARGETVATRCATSSCARASSRRASSRFAESPATRARAASKAATARSRSASAERVWASAWV